LSQLTRSIKRASLIDSALQLFGFSPTSLCSSRGGFVDLHAVSSLYPLNIIVTWFSLFNIIICGLFFKNPMLFSSFSQVGQELGEKSTLEMGMESKLP